MQIPSTPHTSTASSLSTANRPVVGQDAVETRSSVMPAVQQPVEVEAAINRQNPANRLTLVDEEVRLYGPFSGANSASASAAEAVVADVVPADVTIADQTPDQSQQQAQQQDGGEEQSAAASDAETADVAVRTASERVATSSRSNEADAPPRTNAADDTSKKTDAVRETRIERVEQQISKLASRDREVRAHEAAHSSIGGQYAGGASFTLKQGPNGISYAIGGEVPIDISAIPDNPEATIRKMQTVQRAALAPAEPSSADRAVAAQAVQIAQQARAQMQSNQAAERATKTESARQQRTEAAEKRSEISDRMTNIHNRFDFSNELGGAQRSRQIAIVAQGYSPLRPGTIGTLLDETV